jgi:hypothetical protein
MSVLRNLEQKLAGLVEGGFGRAFRTEVGVSEIARRLAREMDEHREGPSSRPTAPADYVVWLSIQDYEAFRGREAEVTGELAGFLLEHARAERLTLPSSPTIELAIDENLGLGEFGIETLAVAELDSEPPVVAEPVPGPEPVPQREPVEGRALLEIEGTRFTVAAGGTLVGRSRECDVVLEDPDVSRRHARIVMGADGRWLVEDLGSTNGVAVNGGRISGAHPIASGDRVTFGKVNGSFVER